MTDTATLPHPFEAADCPAGATMRAIRHTRYGSADVLQATEVPAPSCEDDEVLIRVRAASVNPYDWHMMTGTPWLVRGQGGLRRPKNQIPGVDFAGTVEAVGVGTTRLAVGDEVFGGASGTFAEWVAVKDEALVTKPENISFEEAAAVPVAALTALQGLRDHGGLQVGQHVCINGAAGGVGTYAVQIAKALGAEVTAVCSTRNVERVRSIGADHVVDYTADDFTAGSERYDMVLDNIGNRKISEIKSALTPNGVYVVVGGPKKNRALGSMTFMLKALLRFKFGSRRAVAFIAERRLEDMSHLRDLLASGEMVSVIDRTYSLAEAADAMRHLETGHARGKIIVVP